MRCGADDREGLERLCRYLTRPALHYERAQRNAACTGAAAEQVNGIQKFKRSPSIAMKSSRSSLVLLGDGAVNVGDSS